MAKHETTIKLNAKDNTGRAFDTAEKGMKDLDSAGEQLIGTIGRIAPAILGAFSVGGLASFAADTVSQVRELRGLSAASGLTAKELNAYGTATKTVGISVEKFADITKDVNDKLGDFIATGGGQFKDFFETVPDDIAPSIDALKELSGPDVLIAVKDAMDAANVSGKEQVFVLESIANDASMLIPLLANTGEELNRIADAQFKLNNTLDAIKVDNIEQVATAWDRAGQSVVSFGRNIIGSEFVTGASKLLGTAAESVASSINEGIFGSAEEQLDDLTESARELQEMLATKIASGGIAFGTRDLSGELEEVNRQIKLLRDQLGHTETMQKQLQESAKAAAELNPELGMAARHMGRLKSEDLAEGMKNAALQARNFGMALDNALDTQNEITSNLEKIQDIGDEREPAREATVLSALSKGQAARFALDRGNVEEASALALEAAQELRRVEEETGKAVLQAGGFIKNFEQIAERALNKAQETQEALVLEIVVDGEKRQFKATKEGVKKANDFTKKQLKEAEKKRA